MCATDRSGTDSPLRPIGRKWFPRRSPKEDDRSAERRESIRLRGRKEVSGPREPAHGTAKRPGAQRQTDLGQLGGGVHHGRDDVAAPSCRRLQRCSPAGGLRRLLAGAWRGPARLPGLTKRLSARGASGLGTRVALRRRVRCRLGIGRAGAGSRRSGDRAALAAATVGAGARKRAEDLRRTLFAHRRT